MEIRTIVGAIGILFLIAPPGAATPMKEVKGQITAVEAIGAGESHLVSLSPTAFFLHPSDHEKVTYSLTAAADVVVVSWTRAHEMGVGRNPLQPNQTLFSAERAPPIQGERRFTNATIHLDVDEPAAALLARTVSPSNFKVDLNGNLRVDVVPETTRWEVGKLADAIGAGGRPAAMAQGYDVLPHLLRITTGPDARLLTEGDLLLHVWRGVVVLEGPEGRSSFRSGEWTENETEASRDEYTQLVSLQLSDGSLELNVQAGALESAVGEASWDLDGTLALAGATAYLEAGGEYYRAERSTFSLSGRLSQFLSNAAGKSDSFDDEIIGTAAHIGLPPAGPLPTRNGFPWVSTIAVALLVTIVGGGGVMGAKWFSRDGQHPLSRAELALVLHRSGRANRLSKRVLRQEPGNTVALFIYGASLLQKGAYEQAIEELEPRMEGAKENRSGLGYVLAYAHASLGHRHEAARWVLVAASDGRLVERMQHDRVLRPYVKAPLIDGLGSGIAYG